MMDKNTLLLAALMAQKNQEKTKRRAGCGGIGCLVIIIGLAAIWFPWEMFFK